MSRIAFLTPLPPQPTGIADYAATVLRRLAGRVDVDVYCNHRSPAQIRGVRIRPASARGLRRLDSYDAVVAQIGNSAAHDWIVDWIRHRPSTVVLHELVLHHLVAHITLGRGRNAEYFEALHRAGGGAEIPQALAGLVGRAEPLWEVAADRYPLTDVVVRDASSVLVHSYHLAGAVRTAGLARDVRVVPFPARPGHRPAPNGSCRGRPVTIGVFGFITKNKRLPVILAAMRILAARNADVRLLVVGGSHARIDPLELATEIGVPQAALSVESYSDRPRYESLLSQVDIGVSLRHPTFGETSAAVVDFMARGIPVVVSTGGWYDELPDDAVVRVAPDGGTEVTILAAALEYLVKDRERRRAMGDASFEYARTVLDPARTADAYIRALLGSAGRADVELSLRRGLARGIGDVGSAFQLPTSPFSEAVAQASAELGLLSRDG